MRTFSAKPKDIARSWYVLDAAKMPLGRLATKAARLLLGKDKPAFTPHVDGGDYVIVVNAASLKVSGNKPDKKIYWRHSGYPGGLYKRTLKEQLDIRPESIIHHAIRGMLPDNKHRSGRLKRLKIYAQADHQHSAQNPTELTLSKKVNP